MISGEENHSDTEEGHEEGQERHLIESRSISCMA
jgi:hypothetical protein